MRNVCNEDHVTKQLTSRLLVFFFEKEHDLEYLFNEMRVKEQTSMTIDAVFPHEHPHVHIYFRHCLICFPQKEDEVIGG